MSLDEPIFDHSTFSQHSERLLQHEVAQRFLEAVVTYARQEGRLSDDHFTVDGTLIKAWASLKKVTTQEALEPSVPAPPARSGQSDRGLPWRAAHQCHASEHHGSRMMENRQGLCVDLRIAPATGTAERDTALAMLHRQARRRIRPTTVGADKGYHCRDFVRPLLR